MIVTAIRRTMKSDHPKMILLIFLIFGMLMFYQMI